MAPRSRIVPGPRRCRSYGRASNNSCRLGVRRQIRYHITCVILDFTLDFRFMSLIQFRQHDFEGLNRFIIPLCPMKLKRPILQMVSKVRRSVQLNDLCIIKIGLYTLYATRASTHHSFSKVFCGHVLPHCSKLCCCRYTDLWFPEGSVRVTIELTLSRQILLP